MISGSWQCLPTHVGCFPVIRDVFLLSSQNEFKMKQMKRWPLHVADRIRQGQECIRLERLMIASLLFTEDDDDDILLASLINGLRRQGRYRGRWGPGEGDAKGFKYLGVLFTWFGRMTEEADWQFGSVVMQVLHRTVVVKTVEPRGIALDLTVCLHYIHHLWSWVPSIDQKDKLTDSSDWNQVPLKSGALSQRDMLRSSDILRKLRVPLLLFGHLIRTSPHRGVLITFSWGKGPGVATYRSLELPGKHWWWEGGLVHPAKPAATAARPRRNWRKWMDEWADWGISNRTKEANDSFVISSLYSSTISSILE